jgi:translation initiation factor IF-2
LPARIFTLAKELKIDSKELVELCAKAGIPGKGSALASLTDDEVVRLKEFVNGRGARPAGARGPSAGAGTATPAAPEKLSRDNYIPPAGVAGKPPVIEPPKKEKPPEAPKKAPEPRPTPKPTPTVRLAQLPPSSTKGPAKPLKPAEPAPQKPDLKLPADVLRASKGGASAKPLADLVKKTEERRRAEEQQQKKPAGRSGAPSAPGRGPLGPLTPEGREQRRRAGGGGGKGAATGKDEISTLGGREARQLNRKRLGTDTGNKRVSLDDDDGRTRKFRKARKPVPTGKNTAAPRKGKIVVSMPCNVRSFSEALGVPGQQVLGKLLQLGMSVTNLMAQLDHDTVDLLASEFGVEIEIRRAQTIDEQLESLSNGQPDDESQMEPRPPVITFLGHVDHGKTSLLDKIIGIDVVSGESGGITQHIRAYQIERGGRRIAFVDTPGHEAFTEMRARGANVTDIAVLVVAADDGVMPQTEEAISHAKAAGVPIVIALNKTDLPGVNYDRIYTQLVTAGLQPTEWGGDVELVKCSALTGAGIDDLIETLMTIAELHELKANPHRKAIGTCLEAELHEGRGVIAKLLVQRGTLKVGDAIVCGMSSGHIKAMYDTLNPRKKVEEAGPSMPVNVTGLDIAPGAGEKFYAMDDIGAARDIAQRRLSQTRVAALGAAPVHVTLENLFDRLGSHEVQTLNIILRADVRGSIEAILKEFGKLDHPEVKIKVLQATVGGISEADVHLADASDAVIIGFNVVPDEKARFLAEQKGVQVRRYDIIYQVTDDLKKALEGLLKPEKREADLGRALVLRTFSISRLGTIAGCRVLSGTMQRNTRLRVIRESRIVGEYPMESLRREKDDAKEVREGLECGIKLAGFNDLKEGDVLECYRIEEVARTL